MSNRIIVSMVVDQSHHIDVIESDQTQDSLESMVTCILYMVLGRLITVANLAANPNNPEHKEFQGLNVVMSFNEETVSGEIEVSPPKSFGEALNSVLERGLQKIFNEMGLQLNYVEGTTFSELDLVAMEVPTEEGLFDEDGDGL